MTELQNALLNAFGESYPGNTLFSPEEPSSSNLNCTIEKMLRRLDESRHIEPRDLWIIGLRFFEHNNQSGFRSELQPLLAEWLRAVWIRIVRDETFRLIRPLQTVPPINLVLTNPGNDRGFIAALLIAASESVGANLSVAYTASLREMASD
jgi:hypothetical protein